MAALLIYYLRGLYYRADEHHLFLMAGGLAFSMLICVVPIVLIVFFVLGSVLDPKALEGQVTAMVDGTVPYGIYAEFVKDILISRARDVIAYKRVYGLVGMLGLLFAASGLFSSMRTILNQAYNIQITRNEAVGKARDFGMVFLVLCFFLASITLLPVLEGIKDAAAASPLFRPFRLDLLENLAFGAGSLSLIFAVFYGLYTLVPYGRLPRSVIAVSAAASALLWEAAEQGFGFYISHFDSMQRMYGAYSLVVVVAFWIYYASVTFILGAVIGQLYRERH